MKPKEIRFRFLTPSIAAAILACTPIVAAEPEDTKRTSDQPAPQSQRDLDASAPASTSSTGDFHKSGMKFGAVEKASQILGRDLMDANHQTLAEIEDLILDLQSGKVVLAIVETEDTNLGESYRLVPPAALKFTGTGYNIDASKLQISPSINLANWRQAVAPSALAGIYEKFGHDRYTSDISKSELRREVEDAADRVEDRLEVKGDDEGATTRDQPARESRDNWGPPQGAPHSQRPTALSGSGAAMNLVRASDLMGEDLEDTSGDDLGRVKDLAIDMENGRVLAAVVSTGGVLGIGDTLRVVPPSVLSANEGADEVRFSGTQDQFDRSIRIAGGSWPAYDEAYVNEVYRVFGMTPSLGHDSGDYRHDREDVKERIQDQEKITDEDKD